MSRELQPPAQPYRQKPTTPTTFWASTRGDRTRRLRKYRHLRWWVKGLSESRRHDLRHFMAARLLGAGVVDPKVVAQRGGWSKVATMLERYAHAVPIRDRAAADVVGEMFAGTRQEP